MVSRRAPAALRWAFLRDWITTLQQHLYYHEREELECGSLHSELKSFCVYIPWPPETTTAYSTKVAKLREAMELVGLALQLDTSAWQLIAQPGNDALEHFDPDDFDDGDLTPRYLIKAYCREAHVIGDTVETIAVVEDLLIKREAAGLSVAYQEARKTILRMDSRRRLRQFQLPVSLLFTPTSMSTAETTAYMTTANAIARGIDTLSQRRTEDGAIEYPFQLTSIVFHPWDFTIDFDEAGASNVLQRFLVPLLLRGVAVPELTLKCTDADAVALGRLLHSVCHPLVPDGLYPSRIAQVDALIVTSPPREPFVALCSALASAQTLSRLQLYAAFSGKRSAKWRALGFALLSRASSSSVRELFIDEDRLLLSDAAAFQQAAESDHPAHIVCGASAAEHPFQLVDRRVRLCQQARIKLHQTSEVLGMGRLQLPSSTYFHAIGSERGSERMQILAPGYGVVYVRCEDIVDVASDDTSRISPRGYLTQLHLAFNHCERGALSTIIQTCGASLLSLDINAADATLVGSDDVHTILTTCRQLRLLRLHRASIGSMEVFTQAYEESECRIATLSLVNVYVSNTSLCMFADTLANPTSRTAATLVEFRYIFNDVGFPGSVARPDPPSVQRFLGMLDVNRTLSFLELSLCDSLYERFADQFHVRDRRELVSHPWDLPLPTKLAFVSCINVVGHVSRKRPRVRDRRVPRLPQDVVQRIFAYARRRVLRVVSATPIVPGIQKRIM